jgi:hypothetical protein
MSIRSRYCCGDASIERDRHQQKEIERREKYAWKRRERYAEKKRTAKQILMALGNHPSQERAKLIMSERKKRPTNETQLELFGLEVPDVAT